jgi:hypothetical protein
LPTTGVFAAHCVSKLLTFGAVVSGACAKAALITAERQSPAARERNRSNVLFVE